MFKISQHKITCRLALTLCLGFAFVAGNAHAQIYKWVDANGVTHYSDERPKDESIELKTIRIAPPPKRIKKEEIIEDENDQQKQAIDQDDNNLDNDNQEKDTANSEQLLAIQTNTEKQKTADIKKSKDSQCKQARKNLAILSQDIPAYLDDKENYRLNWGGDTYSGERIYLSDQDHASALGKTKKAIQEHCTNPNDKEAQELARKMWVTAEYCDMNRAILDDLQRAEIRATRRQVLKQQALTDKYCNADETLLSSSEYTEPELFPRNSR